MKLSFIRYTVDLTLDAALGVVLGLLVDKITDIIAFHLKLNYVSKIILQLLLIVIVFYYLKVESKYLYESSLGDTAYGIIFPALFLASQKNLFNFIDQLHNL